MLGFLSAELCSGLNYPLQVTFEDSCCGEGEQPALLLYPRWSKELRCSINFKTCLPALSNWSFRGWFPSRGRCGLGVERLEHRQSRRWVTARSEAAGAVILPPELGCSTAGFNALLFLTCRYFKAGRRTEYFSLLPCSYCSSTLIVIEVCLCCSRKAFLKLNTAVMHICLMKRASFRSGHFAQFAVLKSKYLCYMFLS